MNKMPRATIAGRQMELSAFTGGFQSPRRLFEVRSILRRLKMHGENTRSRRGVPQAQSGVHGIYVLAAMMRALSSCTILSYHCMKQHRRQMACLL